jgi:hypothetical protein
VPSVFLAATVNEDVVPVTATHQDDGIAPGLAIPTMTINPLGPLSCRDLRGNALHRGQMEFKSQLIEGTS